ncbi:MAG: hypothetical protein HY336_01850 [Candidatus Doudnabacteria bacterium]|nr:hypothetical protein [Candidatus Doudnabacteria bacterium]
MQELVQQVIDKISTGSNFLILLPQQPDGDGIGAALAMRAFLKKMEKEVTLVAPGLGFEQKFNFLPDFGQIQTNLSVTKNLVIDVSNKRVQIEELSYKKEQDRLSIYIRPKAGQLEPSDVSFRSSNFPFEYIVCLGIASLDQLGDFYSNNTELFFETPIINIDHSATNDNYGQINLVRLNSTSNSEIVFDLINNYEGSLVDQNMATQLLTGIITKTNSFQHARTTPAAFVKASQLVSLGGDQQEIIKQLYKTKSLGLLKLWGRVLARLKLTPQLNLALSEINSSDIEKAGASSNDIEGIIKEMASELGMAKIFAFLIEESPNSTMCFVASAIPLDLVSVFKVFHPEPSVNGVKFRVNGNLAFSEMQLTSLLQGETDKT